MVGQNIGKYRVLDRVGRGGMGTVYRAIDETLHREVAIKVLNAELNDPEVAKRFRAEAITVARLSHPGIATIYELFQHEGQWLMVMEFVRGETLEHMVERMGACSPQRAADLCMQALAALAHAHSMGVVHRDLKPANLMITETGAIKIMDFGIARVTGTEHLTNAGFMMGTPAYMAPEQVMGQEIDARSDLYAMGVVFYRLTAGKLPFKGDTPFAMAQSQVNDPPTPIGLFRADLPRWVEPVVVKALAKSPEERFQSSVEFHEAFARCLAGLPMQSTYSSSAPTELMMTPNRGMSSSGMHAPIAPTAPYPIPMAPPMAPSQSTGAQQPSFSSGAQPAPGTGAQPAPSTEPEPLGLPDMRSGAIQFGPIDPATDPGMTMLSGSVPASLVGGAANLPAAGGPVSGTTPVVPPPGTGAIPVSTGAIPTGTGAIPTGTGALPVGTGAIPTGTGTIPVGTGAIPTGTGAVPMPTTGVPISAGSVPTPTAAVPASVAAAATAAAAMPGVAAKAAGASKGAGGSRTRDNLILIVAAAVLLAAAGGGALWFRSRPGAPQPVAETPAPAPDPVVVAPPPVDPNAAPPTGDPAAVTPPAAVPGAPTSTTPGPVAVVTAPGSSTSTPAAPRGASTPLPPPAGARGTAPTSAVPAPVAPGRSGTAAPEPAVDDTHQAFTDVKAFTVSGKKTSDQDVVLSFVAGQISVLAKKGGNALTAVPYKSLVKATYIKARDPKWDTSLPGPPDDVSVGSVLRTSKQWLVLQTKDSYAILRLDDSNVTKVLETLEARTHITIDRPKSNDK